MKKVNRTQPRPVVFGEVLFDVFPDGRALLGGAPFNVAWHLEGFGCRPIFISQVGDDERGRRILDAMERWEMDTRGVPIDKKHPTGEVAVSINDGEPDYRIMPERAFDFIDAKDAWKKISKERLSLLYHGTLIARTPVSKASLKSFTASASLPVFLDVNLRKDCWNATGLSEFIHTATWLKLNEAEWKIVRKLPPPKAEEKPEKSKLKSVREEGVRDCARIMTKGKKGAEIITEDGLVYSRKPDTAIRVIDTVGAGDAFSAVTILGLLRGWDWETILRRAITFSSRVCTLRGAVSEDRSFYEGLLKDWGA